ncbi:MAG: DUF5320 domain-containing protein [Syntrophomonadaceae bacterium]|nr:DUF5320 domain-containing protein [Syntrophomonadaceae bacterium]
MPGGDRTGPLGMGPKTGRRGGYCTGNAVPDYTGYNQGRFFGGWGRGVRRGGGRGRSFGFGWGYMAPYPYPVYTGENDRLDSLEQQARYLEDSLEAIRREISEVKARKEED